MKINPFIETKTETVTETRQVTRRVSTLDAEQLKQLIKEYFAQQGEVAIGFNCIFTAKENEDDIMNGAIYPRLTTTLDSVELTFATPVTVK